MPLGASMKYDHNNGTKSNSLAGPGGSVNNSKRIDPTTTSANTTTYASLGPGLSNFISFLADASSGEITV